MTPRDPRPVTSRTSRGPPARGWLLRHASPLAWVAHSGPLVHPTPWSRDRQEALGQSSHCDAGLDCPQEGGQGVAGLLCPQEEESPCGEGTLKRDRSFSEHDLAQLRSEVTSGLQPAPQPPGGLELPRPRAGSMQSWRPSPLEPGMCHLPPWMSSCRLCCSRGSLRCRRDIYHLRQPRPTF